MRRRLLVGGIVLALCAGLLGGLAPTPTVTSPSAVGELAPQSASAGIGYWSNGCNPHAEWFQYQSDVNWKVWTRNEYNKTFTTYNIIHALRRMYGGAGNECGSLGELNGWEQAGQWRHVRGMWRRGWTQAAVGGALFWDEVDCSYSYVYERAFGAYWLNQCRYA